MDLRSRVVLVAMAGLGWVGGAAGAELNAHLKPFAGMVGKTWRGTLSAPGAAKTLVDVQRWEEALNGQAVRITHSINDGEYGGQSMVVWDKEQQALVYTYFTTADFYTTGTMKDEGGTLVSQETVKGDADGISQVKGTMSLTAEGKLRVHTQYFQKGAWVEGRNTEYVEAREGAVKFH